MVFSAGILVYRMNKNLEVLLVHPGGPFWNKKDINAWSIPKGELTEGEDEFNAAKREFYEETSLLIDGEYIDLGKVKQSSKKIVHVWAVEGEIDHNIVKSNTFTLEYPIKSGNFQEYPEIDKASWFSIKEAKIKIHKGQIGFLEKLCLILNQTYTNDNEN
jgi:predicted NUDIX family NTP pyrophosphohydrolase